MIDVTAPLRLSLAGGGSDLPEHYERHGCRLLAVALTAHGALRLAEAPEGVTVRAFGTETRAEHASSHPDPLVRAALGYFGIDRGVHLTVESDVAPGSGLGGSGAFLVALATALSHLTGDPLTPAAAARAAFRIERALCGRPVGQQDHWTAASGAAIELRIAPDGTADARPDPELYEALGPLLDHRLLPCAPPHTFRPTPLAAQARALRGKRDMTHIQSLVDDVRKALVAADIARVGALLHEHWTAKRAVSDAMSTPEIDRWYAMVRDHGAYGAKLVGAGGGGHLLVATEAADADRLTTAMAAEGLTRVVVGTHPLGVTAHREEGRA
uniref:LmbP protein n=1 Tax=Streptomyces lincolnensis TaxID=1915 RepID=Q54369_STRLN|nr:lmbP [Streptomyces lincolnensis]